MDDAFKIYVEQLRKGDVEKINEKFDPSFLDIQEKELVFEDPILVIGEAYTTESELILHLEISTYAKLPCSICNEPVKIPVRLNNFYHSEPIERIKGGIFSMMDMLREGILLETPSFAECNEGLCPKRKDLERFFKKTTTEEESEYRPFDHLK